MDSARIQELLFRYIQQTATQEETEELMRIAADPDLQHLLKEAIGSMWEKWPSTELLVKEQSASLFQSIKRSANVKNFRVTPTRWIPWTAAACAVGIVLAIWLLPDKQTQQSPAIAVQSKSSDVPPPSASHAMLTLSDGTQIPLDSMVNTSTYGDASIAVNKNGEHEVKYSATTNTGVNTLFNPIGSKVVTLVLSDGSKLWLNSGSSVTYPTGFTGEQRKVSMSGEIYFEVAKDRTKPFLVAARNFEVKVLGTHFNVNAYDEDPLSRATLLEGSVLVSQHQSKQLLKPGQQSEVGNAGIKLINDADLESTMAWKNGFMSFRSADIPSILLQIQRWYGVNVKYPENMPRRTFTGDVSRTLTLNQVLKLLEVSKIHFKLENNVLTVLP